MNAALLGWALAAVAVVAGYLGYGWRGLALAVTVICFWLLLQFSRAVRALRVTAQAPIGEVDNAVMLHARLRTGLRLPEVLRLTRSLGRKVAAEPAPADEETWAWRDAAGDQVQVLLRRGRVHSWQLLRAAAGSAEADPASAPRTTA